MTIVLQDTSIDSLVTDNIPLVHSVLRSVAAHFPRHADQSELIQAGALGLVEAARRFDPSRGARFEYWAALRIRGAMLDAVRSIDTAPRSVRATARRVEASREQLAQQLRRTPTDREIADHLDMPAEVLHDLLAKIHESVMLSLDAPLGDEDGTPTSIAETVAGEENGDPYRLLERNEHHAYLRDALAELPERLRDVVEAYFFGGDSSEEIAARLGVTTSRVSQMRTQALSLMKSAIDAQYADRPARPARPVRESIVERRQFAYIAAVSSRSTHHARLSAGSGPRREAS